MIRLMTGFAIFVCLLSAASASPSMRKVTAPLLVAEKSVSQRSITMPAWSSDFQMLDNTDILLDGKPCKYVQVPASATIHTLEVAADRKTILKIHFRSQK